MAKRIGILAILALIAGLVFAFAQENITITTYYPSPSGVYGNLTVIGGSVLFNGTTGTTPASGAGRRLMWIPSKAAFRAGEVAGAGWDNASIGVGSFAAGYNTTASGNFATAMGYDSVAAGSAAFAVGSAQALGSVAIAMGNGPVALGTSSHAIGGVTTNGDFSTAIGLYLTANGLNAMVLGRGVDDLNRLTNGIDRSLMVGFNSNIPTLFVGPSSGIGTTGNVGIGTTTPKNKLDVEGAVVIGATYSGADTAPANGLLVEGNVGIGTTTPTAKLHVDGSAGTMSLFNAGDLYSQGDITAGYGGGGSSVIYQGFKVRSVPVGPDLFTVDGSGNGYFAGNVGIGTTSPNRTLHIYGSNAAMAIQDSNAGGREYVFTNLAPGDGSLGLYDQTGAAFRWLVNSSGNMGIGTTNPGTYKLYVEGEAWSTIAWSGSDKRWKKNIKTLADPLSKIMKLRGVTFNWRREEFGEKNFPQGKSIGIIAQELEKEFPELVNADAEGYKAIAYDRFTAVLLEAIKSQQKEIEALKKQISRLSN